MFPKLEIEQKNSKFIEGEKEINSQRKIFKIDTVIINIHRTYAKNILLYYCE